MRYLLCCLMAVFLFTAAALPASYVIKPGDCLYKLSPKLGFSVSELCLMNDLNTAGNKWIYAGDTLVYLTQQDINDAIYWCDKRMIELPPVDENFRHFQYTKEDLRSGKLRFSIYEPSGTHYTSVLCFAQAWRDFCQTHYSNNRHPELQPGEIWLTNTSPYSFANIPWSTKRMGRIAYGMRGNMVNPKEGVKPVFVKRSELEQHGVSIDTLIMINEGIY